MAKRGRILFKTWAERILERKRHRAPKTFRSATDHFRKLTEFLGGRFLYQINEDTWAAYVAHCRKINQKRRLFDDRKHLNSILLAAHEEGLLPRRISLFSPDAPRNVGREVTEAELGRIFQHASPELTFQIEIAFKMGLRLREMLRLEWDRFDWEARAIRLRSEDTKTRRGRIVPINEDVFDRFRARFLRSKSRFVFPARGRHDRPQNDNKTAWKNALRKAGVRCRWHDLRHTCASLLLRRGASTAVVTTMLGMSERVLLRIYQHLNLDDLHRAAQLLSVKTR